MASSKLMASPPSRNLDLTRRSSSSSFTKSTSISDFHHINASGVHSLCPMTLDGFLRNVYGDSQASESTTLVDAQITLLDAAGAIEPIGENEGGRTILRQESVSSGPKKTVDDVWGEIVNEKREYKMEVKEELMTLEDFLAKAAAVEEEKEDVKLGLPVKPLTERLSGGVFAFDDQLPPKQLVDGAVGLANGIEVVGGRDKRGAFDSLDKAAAQRQKRMIKNRESAARSRERKQAYQVELESLTMKLEEENACLLLEKAERTKQRYKQLMEIVVPAVVKRRPAHALGRVRSI